MIRLLQPAFVGVDVALAGAGPVMTHPAATRSTTVAAALAGPSTHAPAALAALDFGGFHASRAAGEHDWATR